MLGFLKLENYMLAEFLVVLAKLEFFSSCEVFLLYVGDISHNSALGRDTRHICAFTFCHETSCLTSK